MSEYVKIYKTLQKEFIQEILNMFPIHGKFWRPLMSFCNRKRFGSRCGPFSDTNCLLLRW